MVRIFSTRSITDPSAPKLHEGDITARAVRSYGEVTLWPQNEGIVVVPLIEIPVVFYRSPTGVEPVRNWLRGLPEGDRRAIGADLALVQVG